MLNKVYIALRNKFDVMALNWRHYDTLERVSVCVLVSVCLAVLVGVMLFPVARFIVGCALALALTMSTLVLTANGILVLFERR